MQNDATLMVLRGPWGIPIQVSPTVLLLLLVFVSLSGIGVETLLDAVLLFAILTASILAHELGHVWAARMLGVRVRRIILHAGGGTCQCKPVEAAKAEFIAITGPLVNLGLWAMLSLAAWAFWNSVPERDLVIPGALAEHRAKLEIAYWFWLASNMNFALFVFNLMPVQPMDGGRLMHLWLSRLMRQDYALQTSGAVGLICCLLWVPAMIVMFFAFGFILLFMPSFRMHLEMLRGGYRLNRPYRQ